MGCSISNYQSPKALIANENIGAESENEPRNVQFARGEYGVCEVIRSKRFVHDIGRTADAERGVWSEWLITADL